MAEMPEAHPEDSGRNLRTYGQDAPNVAARRELSRPEESELIDAVVDRENMKRALRREWPRIKEELLNGTYRPVPVGTAEIPKPGGKGTRMLGIPTALDRLIQQALHQVVSPLFDRANHDILMSRVARRVSDKRVLKLIRSYLQAGMMQGGPLSPLLSNILLDDLDKELEQRGHAFCGYADDRAPRRQTG